jgi:hypothetical protein
MISFTLASYIFIAPLFAVQKFDGDFDAGRGCFPGPSDN